MRMNYIESHPAKNWEISGQIKDISHTHEGKIQPTLAIGLLALTSCCLTVQCTRATIRPPLLPLPITSRP